MLKPARLLNGLPPLIHLKHVLLQTQFQLCLSTHRDPRQHTSPSPRPHSRLHAHSNTGIFTLWCSYWLISYRSISCHWRRMNKMNNKQTNKQILLKKTHPNNTRTRGFKLLICPDSCHFLDPPLYFLLNMICLYFLDSFLTSFPCQMPLLSFTIRVVSTICGHRLWLKRRVWVMAHTPMSGKQKGQVFAS